VGHEDRVGYYMHTASGLPYWPCDPRVEDVRLEDIAHHLSMQCRFAGASTRFLSVAEHSIACSAIGPADEALERLMHDAAEAYLQDWIRPIKYLPEVNAIYTQLEALNEKVIAEKFELTYPFPPSVKIADEMVVTAELAQNIAAKDKGHMHDSSKCPHINFEYWEPEEAKIQFLAMYQYLRSKRKHLRVAA
jgi:5'-deoxynucleotidase YfbR-like HD superfamily hydrolase